MTCVEDVVAVEVLTEVDHIVEVLLLVIAEVKGDTTIAVIVKEEVEVIVEAEVEVGLAVIVVDATGEMLAEIGEIAIGIVKVGDAEAAEDQEGLLVTVEAEVSV